MKFKTIKDLNEKWWYRLVKVFFVLCFIFITAFLLMLFPDYDYYNKKTVDNLKTTIVCNKGNENSFSPKEIGVVLTSSAINDAISKKIKNKCNISNMLTAREVAQLYNEYINIDATFDRVTFDEFADRLRDRGYILENSSDKHFYKITVNAIVNSPNIGEYIRPYKIDRVYVKENGGWFAIIGVVLLFLIGVGLVFEIIKRAFYYIIFSKIKPDKK